MREPPRRLLLAANLVDRAEFGEIRRLESNPFLEDDDLYPRNMSLMRVEARIGGARTYASMLPVHNGLDLPDKFVMDSMKSSMVSTIANNPNVVGPRGRLPQ